MPSRTRLSDHMRTHTKEKVVGCPVCGQLFATNTKLHDHVTRQITTCKYKVCLKKIIYILMYDGGYCHINLLD